MNVKIFSNEEIKIIFRHLRCLFAFKFIRPRKYVFITRGSEATHLKN